MPTSTERPPSTGRSYATLPVVVVLGAAAAILFFYDRPPASFAAACALGGASSALLPRTLPPRAAQLATTALLVLPYTLAAGFWIRGDNYGLRLVQGGAVALFALAATAWVDARQA
jgi:hypothetical protein